VIYVREFLARPEETLTAMDGLREYGAAIFPGFLWLRHGESSLWQLVFGDAYGEGVETAIQRALAARGGPTLAEVVAAFWSSAAHPEDTWPDGDLYYATSAPKLLGSVVELPLEVATSADTAPGRYGANLFEIPGSEKPVTLHVSSADPGSIWQASLSTGGAGDDPAVAVVAAGETPMTFDWQGEGRAYLAVVNVTTEDGYKNYAARIDSLASLGVLPGPDEDDGLADVGVVMDDGVGPTASGGGGSSGCFLQILGLR
jgi:hypothetical protein